MKRTRAELNKELETVRRELPYDAYQEKQRQMTAEWYNELEPGDHCHKCCWSDIEPCTVINRTAKSITVRFDKATLAKDWKPEFVTGGFSAICTNIHDQRWDIEEDPEGEVEVFRWSKRLNCFKNKSDERLYPGWYKFYDYNF